MVCVTHGHADRQSQDNGQKQVAQRVPFPMILAARRTSTRPFGFGHIESTRILIRNYDV